MIVARDGGGDDRWMGIGSKAESEVGGVSDEGVE